MEKYYVRPNQTCNRKKLKYTDKVMPIKYPSLFLLIIATAALASACVRAPQTDDTLQLSNSDNFSLESDANLNPNNIAEAEGAANNAMNQQRQVKTIEDFKAIEASEAVLTTSKGEVVIELYTDRAPLTTASFLNLIDQGFYDGIVIHRVEPNFVVQFGDPLTKEPGNESLWGTGGPGYTFADEFHPELRHDSEGILSMANAGPNTGGSQVFITLNETSFLDDKHAVFGKVSQGMDVVKTLQRGDTITKAVYR